MSQPPENRVQGNLDAVKQLEKAPETLALNFYEPAPVNKLIFTLKPTPWDVRLTQLSYSFGSLDLSANGYIQLVLTKALNPNIYGTIEQNSNTIFSRMGGANIVTQGDVYYKNNNIVLIKNEPAYLYLISNIPPSMQGPLNVGGVFGRIAIFYLPLYQ